MRKLLIAMAASLLPVTAAAQDSGQEEFVRVWDIDFSGRPPFVRVLKKVPAVDVAALETTGTVETEVVWHVDFSGKPPFRRSYREVPVIDAASLEIVDAGAQRGKRQKNRFKRHR